MIDICEHMGFSKPSVSPAISSLKSGGYVTANSDGHLISDESLSAISDLSKNKFYISGDIMKKIVAIMLAVFCLMGVLCSCSGDDTDSASSQIILKDEDGEIIADTNNGDKVEIDNETGEITITDKDGNETVIDTNKNPTTVIQGSGDKETSSQIKGPFESSSSDDSSSNVTSGTSSESSTPSVDENTSSTPSDSTSSGTQTIIDGIETAEDWL